MSRRTSDTPPTAVALRYEGNGAPRVTAKGQGEVAEQILAIAAEHGVPVREEPELAALLARVDLGEEIPPALYVAVAEVLAFAYRLSGRVPSGVAEASEPGGTGRRDGPPA